MKEKEKEPKFRSPLERRTWEKLVEAGLKFGYESVKVELQPAFTSSVDSIEGRHKVFSKISPKVKPITYTPDFVGDGWVIEVKGQRTPDFNIKWKMYKMYLTQRGENVTLYLPRSIKHVESCVQEIVKNVRPKRRNKKVLPKSQNIELSAGSPEQPKVSKAKGTRVDRRRGKAVL